jgi:ATP phosphoribosyltransferase
VQQLKLGVPKGSLQEATISLFQKSGWRISLSSRNYFPEINDTEISCSICRAQEMSRYVERKSVVPFAVPRRCLGTLRVGLSMWG